MAVLFGITVPVVQWLIKTGEGIGKGPVPHTLRDPHARRGGCGIGTDGQTHRRSTDPRKEGRQPLSRLQGTSCNCAHAKETPGDCPQLERMKGHLGRREAPPPCLPMSGGCPPPQMPPAPPWQSFFPLRPPTPGRDAPGGGELREDSLGWGNTHMGVSFIAARSH